MVSGFSGVWIDRFGYTDSELEKLEEFLASELGLPVATSNSGRYTLFDLSKKSEKWNQEASSTELIDAKRSLFSPAEFAFENGFFQREIDPASGASFLWSSQLSTVSVYNTSTKKLRFEFRALISSNPGGVLSILSPGSQKIFEIKDRETPISFSFELEPRKRTTIELRFNGTRIHAPSDPREMYFSLVNPTLHEVN